MTTQPTAMRLFTHQLLDHEGKPNEVHIGCDDLEVCKQSHVDGETSSVIHEWVAAAELRRLVAQRDQLLKALKKIEAIEDKMCSQTQRARDIARAAIRDVEE